MSRTWLWGVLALVLSLLAAALGVAPRAAVPPPPSGVLLVVAPHPDDEYQAWAMVDAHPAGYVVFLTLTEGENSEACLYPAWFSRSTERDPALTLAADEPTLRGTNPWDGLQGTTASTPAHNPGCRAARIDSERQFISAVLTSEGRPALAPPGTPAVPVCFDAAPHGKDSCALAVAGPGAALVSLDLGDLDADPATAPYALQPADVVWAVQHVAAGLGALGVPASAGPVTAVVGAGLYNSTRPGPGGQAAFATAAGASCDLVDHWNHWALATALATTVVAGVDNYIRTCSGNPAVAKTGGVVAAVTPTLATRVWTVIGPPTSPGFTVLGPGSSIYGWLDPYAFPYSIQPPLNGGDLGCLTAPVPANQTEGAWSCVQAFWRHAAG